MQKKKNKVRLQEENKLRAPKPRRQGHSERVLSRMEKLTQMASKVEPPRVVRHSNKKPRRVRRRY